MEQNEKSEIIDPLLDTGKAAREALRIAQQVYEIAKKIDQRAALIEEMERKDHEEKEKMRVVIKRHLTGLLKGLGLID